ncbi:MAG TPA: hypothetical protein VIE13_01075 [Terriglobales bacterium]|jgi:hypothetical protein
MSTIVHRWISGCASATLLLGASLAAQVPAKPAPLSHEQKLQIQDYAKDVKLAQQQIELLKVQLAGAMLGEQRSVQQFNAYLEQLRKDLNAPASDWDFDGATLAFVPKGGKGAAPAAKPAPAAAKKPGGGGGY